MTRTRRQQQSIVIDSAPAASRRLRQRTRPDYHESSDSAASPSFQPTQFVASSQDSASSQYAVKAILDQRYNSDDEIEYLIDWADHPTTKQSYTPSWEPRINVSSAAEAAWLQQQRQSQRDFDIDASSASSSNHLNSPSEVVEQDTDPSPPIDADNLANHNTAQCNHGNSSFLVTTQPPTRARRRAVVESSPSQSSPSARIIIPSSNSASVQSLPRNSAIASTTKRARYVVDKADQSDEAENFQPNPSEKTLQPRTSNYSTSIDYSAEYHPSRSLHSSLASAGASTSIDEQSGASRDSCVDSRASRGSDHVASGSAPDFGTNPAPFLYSTSTSSVDPFRVSFKTPRRFSTLAVIPDSQDSRQSWSRRSSVTNKADQSIYSEPSITATINQVAEDPISSVGQLHLSERLSSFDKFDPIIPETPSVAVTSHQSLVRSAAASQHFAQPQDSSIKHISDSNLSLTQSGYLGSSEDEGFGGSEPDEAAFQSLEAHLESLPNAQDLDYSSLELSVSHSQRASQSRHSSLEGDFTTELHFAPQSTNPRLLSHNFINNMADQPAGSEMELDEPLVQQPDAIEPAAEAPTTQPSTTRSTRAARNGTAAANSQTDDADAPAPRKSLRGLRKEAENKRAEIKARTQKPSETNQDLLDSKQRTPESETQSSTGASKGRGRKKKDAQSEPAGLNADSKAKMNGTSVSNGEINSKIVTPHISLGPKLPDMQFIVPMPLVSQAGDQYRRTVVYNKVLIENFTATHDPTPDLVSDAGQFVQTMRDICMHLDLANEEESLENVLPSQQMTWDRSISSKFQLISILITKLQEQKLQLVIFAAPGKNIDMVEKFLRGHDINFTREDDTPVSESSSKEDRLLQVHLIDSKAGLPAAVDYKADLVIALDHSMDVNQPAIRDIRQHDSRLAPIIFLTVLNSIDHIDRVMASSWKGAARIQTEVACIARLRMEAGKLNDDYQSVPDVGQLISQFVIDSGNEDDWPVVPIGPLADNESWDLAMGHTVLRNNENEPLRKRSQGSTAENDTRGVRKTRSSGSFSTSQAVDSQANVTQAELLRQLSEQSAQHVKAQDELKAQLTDLKHTMKRKDAHVRTMEKDFDKQMNRFEGQTRELEAIRQELEEANEKITQIRDLKSRRDDTIVTLREEIGELKNRLTETNKLLESSSIPEISELAQLRREKDEAVAALDKAIKQADSAQKLTGYLQEQYRKASDQAVDAVEQNDVLEARVKDLERKASGEAVRLQEASSDTRQKMTMTELERLKVELKNVKAVLAKKEEELKAKRSGIGTRAGSVPRSPRVGPASRATSPIPDRRIENLRNNTFTGRGKAKNPRKTLDAEDAAIARAMAKQKKESPQKPKAASGTDGGEPAKEDENSVPDSQSASQETPNGADKMADIQPAQPAKSSAADSKSGPPTSRPFPCTFAQYNCNASFTSKNEWKRHISTKHIQIGFWRCDMCNPSPGLDHPVFNDFNRKDLFTQHLRRMHAPAVLSAPGTPNPNVPSIREDSSAASPSQSSGALGVLTEEQIQEIVKRCFRILRQPPQVSRCLFCMRRFSGPNSWEERLEHVGGHMERDRKNGTNCQDISNWKEDEELRQYLVTEGIVEQDQRGNWRIGDGRPRRPTDIQMPSTPMGASASSSQTPGTGMLDQESDGSMSRRRRGRPPKRPADFDHPPRAAPSLAAPPLNQAGYADVRPRLEHNLQPSLSNTGSQGTPSQHPTSDLRGPPTPIRMDSNPSTPLSARAPSGTHPRLEPYPHSQHNPSIHPSLQGHTYPTHSSSQQSPYAREPSPTQQRAQLLPHIMPRTPQNVPGQAPQLSPLGGSHSTGMPSPVGYPGQYSHTYPQPQASGSQGILPHNLQALQQQAIAAAAIGGSSLGTTSPTQSGHQSFATAPSRTASVYPASSQSQQSATQTQQQQQQQSPYNPNNNSNNSNNTTQQQDLALHNHNLHLVRQHLDATQALEQQQQQEQQQRPPSTGTAMPPSELSAEEQANRARTFHEVIGERNNSEQR